MCEVCEEESLIRARSGHWVSAQERPSSAWPTFVCNPVADNSMVASNAKSRDWRIRVPQPGAVAQCSNECDERRGSCRLLG